MLVNRLVIVSVVWGLKYSNMTISFWSNSTQLIRVPFVLLFVELKVPSWSYPEHFLALAVVGALQQSTFLLSYLLGTLPVIFFTCFHNFSHLPTISQVFSEDISTTVHRAQLSLKKSVPPELNTSERWDWTRGDVSSKDKLCDQPLVQDLYEYLRVEVRESTIRSDTCYQSGIGGCLEVRARMMKLEDLC